MADAPAIEAIIVPSARDLGDGYEVRRALPAAKRRAVGPFVYLDEMGPVAMSPGSGLDVRPHPHIGLATLTYLFEGEILHQDSLGVRGRQLDDRGPRHRALRAHATGDARERAHGVGAAILARTPGA